MTNGHTPRCAEFTCTSCDKARQWTRTARAKARMGVPVVSRPRPEWHADGLCSQVDGDLWFPEKGGSTRDAKRICLSCPVLVECRSYALAHEERFGIWGGLSERERRQLRRQAVPA